MIIKKLKFTRSKPTIIKSKPLSKSIDRIPILEENNSIPTYLANETRIKICIIAPGSWGDNINSTLMLKPLWQKFHDPIIDIYSSTLYATAFHNNPHINKIIRFKTIHKQEALHLVHTIPPLIANCGYNYIFNPHPMINADKWTSVRFQELGTNLICAWVRALEHANIPFELPLETVLRLTNNEVSKVDKFCSSVANFSERIKNLVENGPESNQTFAKPDLMFKIMDIICGNDQIVFASMKNNSNHFNLLKRKYPKRFYFVGQLTVRECAELYNRSDRFISLSSGLSNACNTNWCNKDKEWIEIINSMVVASYPIRSENKIFWTENNREKLLEFIMNKIKPQ